MSEHKPVCPQCGSAQRVVEKPFLADRWWCVPCDYRWSEARAPEPDSSSPVPSADKQDPPAVGCSPDATTEGGDERTVSIPAGVAHRGHTVSVTLRWVCPKCGGPRGEVSQTLAWDGSQRVSCNGWANPCGHIDKYSACRAEARATQKRDGLGPGSETTAQDRTGQAPPVTKSTEAPESPAPSKEVW